MTRCNAQPRNIAPWERPCNKQITAALRVGQRSGPRRTVRRKAALLWWLGAQKSPVGVSGKAMSSSSEIGGASGGGSWIGWKPRNSSFLCVEIHAVVLCVTTWNAQDSADVWKFWWLGHAGRSAVHISANAAQQRGEA